MTGSVDKAVLEGILKHLSPRRFRISKELLIVNESWHTAFDVSALKEQWKMGGHSEFLTVLNHVDLAEYNDPKFYKWAPGLVGPGITAEEFAETMVKALKRV